jgi:hypothetical protein
LPISKHAKILQEFFDENIETGRTIKGGFLKDAGDVAGDAG